METQLIYYGFAVYTNPPSSDAELLGYFSQPEIQENIRAICRNYAIKDSNDDDIGFSYVSLYGTQKENTNEQYAFLNKPYAFLDDPDFFFTEHDSIYYKNNIFPVNDSFLLIFGSNLANITNSMPEFDWIGYINSIRGEIQTKIIPQIPSEQIEFLKVINLNRDLLVSINPYQQMPVMQNNWFKSSSDEGSSSDEDDLSKFFQKLNISRPAEKHDDINGEFEIAHPSENYQEEDYGTLLQKYNKLREDYDQLLHSCYEMHKDYEIDSKELKKTRKNMIALYDELDALKGNTVYASASASSASPKKRVIHLKKGGSKKRKSRKSNGRKNNTKKSKQH